jgi:hypothetical protein
MDEERARKRTFLRWFSLAWLTGLTLAVSVLFIILWARTGLRASYEEIQVGMTKGQVDTILVNATRGPTAVGMGHSTITYAEKGDTWFSPGDLVIIYMDSEDRVIDKHLSRRGILEVWYSVRAITTMRHW